MAHQHPRGPLVPDPQDRIVESISQMVDTMGLIRAVSTPDEARSIIRAAAATGTPPTSTNPMFFFLNDILASNDGEGATTNPVLRPATMVDWASTNNTVSGSVNVGAGAYSKLCEAVIPARPYQRIAFAIASLWGHNAQGKRVDLEVWLNGVKGRSRLGEWDDSTSAHCLGIIPANTVPNVSMWLRGAPGGSQVTVSADDWSKLSVMAFPCPAL